MSRAGGDTRSLLQVLVDRQVHTDACVDKLKDKVDVLSASHVEHKASIDAGVRAAKWLIGLSIAILGIGGPMGTACYVESIHHQHVSVAEARP